MGTTNAALPAKTGSREIRGILKPLEPQLQAVEAELHEFEAKLPGFTERLKALKLMELGPLKAHCAGEYLRECADFSRRVQKSKLRSLIAGVVRLHKFLTRIVGEIEAPVRALDTESRTVASDWEQHRLQLIAQQKLEQQAADIERQEEARLAEAVALESQGRAAEAEAVLERPIVSSVATVDENQGKVEGQSLVQVWVPAHDEKNTVLFASAEDQQVFLRWASENIAFNHLLEVKYGALKRLLTDNRGLLQPPGIVIEHKYEPRVATGK